MQVRDVMTTRPHYLGEEATLRDVAEAMRDNKSGFEPLTNEEKVVGVLTDRDLVIEGIAGGKNVDDSAQTIATSKVLYTYGDTSVDEVLTNMEEQQVQRLLVLESGDNKELVGVVTIGDIANHCEDAEMAKKLVSAIRQYQY